MAKPNLKKLREDFNNLLAEVWKVWDEVEPDDEEEAEAEWGDTPFETRQWTWEANLDEQERENIREDLGWLLGVAAVTGWKLYKPGPREWTPK